MLDGGRPFVINTLEDGSQSVELRVQSDDHLRRILPDLAAALGMSVQDVKSMLKAKGQFRRVSQRVEIHHHQLSLGGPDAMRSMFKTCLVIWADRHGNPEVLNQRYDQARQFVRNGDEALARSICQLDVIPFEASERLAQSFGPHFNLAVVASDEAGRTVGYFRLYNICAWRFVLCEQGGPASSIVGLLSNPEDPRVWRTINNEDLIPVSTILASQPGLAFKSARDSLTGMYAAYHNAASKTEIEKIVRQVAEKRGLADDQPMTRQQFEQFSGEVFHRVALWRCGLPFEESLGPDEISGLLGHGDNDKS